LFCHVLRTQINQEPTILALFSLPTPINIEPNLLHI